MSQSSKRKIIQLGSLILLLIGYIRRKPESLPGLVAKVFVLGNIIIFLLGSIILQYMFRHRYRMIIQMLDYFTAQFNPDIDYSFTPVSLIKYNLTHEIPGHTTQSTHHDGSSNSIKGNIEQGSHQISGKNYSFYSRTDNNQHKLYIIIDTQENIFLHDLHEEDIYDLASVLIYLLQQGVDYSTLASHTSLLHTILYTS